MYVEMKRQKKASLQKDQLLSRKDTEKLVLQKTIEQLTDGYSNRLRAHLKSITGLVNMLQDAGKNTGIDPNLCMLSIEKTISKMEHSLNEFEQFLSNTKLSMAGTAIDTRQEIALLLADFESIITHKKIRIIVNIEQPAPFVTDKNLFRVAISHLLSNAINFQDNAKDHKQININIRTNATVCIVQIADNGIGIKEKILPHIFQLFYRGSDQSTGTGTGLYIVKEIVDKMDGTIAVSSQPARGSDFIISVPNLAMHNNTTTPANAQAAIQTGAT